MAVKFNSPLFKSTHLLFVLIAEATRVKYGALYAPTSSETVLSLLAVFVHQPEPENGPRDEVLQEDRLKSRSRV